MDHVNKYINYSTQDRLNDILDKINNIGRKSLSEIEIEFLESFSSHEEDNMNDTLKKYEMEDIFQSDDLLFTFKLDEVLRYSDQIHLIGTLTVPDMGKRGKIIDGVLYGKIIIFNKDQFAIEFSDGKYDVFEFVSGVEYELDIFISDIIKKFKFD